MIKLDGLEIYVVCTLGRWSGMIYKNDKLVYHTLEYPDRETAVNMAKLLSHNWR